AGKTPRPDSGALTIKDVANAYLTAKQEAVAAGELSPRTWADYKQIMDSLIAGFGKHKLVATLDPQDFAALRNKLAKKNGPPRMSTIVQVIRCAFKFAYDSAIIDKPVRFGPQFRRTSKKALRLHRSKQGAKLFTREEVRRLLDSAGIPLKAMLLLGINAGFGN